MPSRGCAMVLRTDAGMYTLDGEPKTVEEAVYRMEYYQHSRQTKSSRSKRNVRQVALEETQHSNQEW